MRDNQRIAGNVRFWMVTLAIVPLLIMAVQGYHCARQAVLQLKTEHLETVAESKRIRIEDWIAERTRDLKMLAAYAALPQTDSAGGPRRPVSLSALFDQVLAGNSAYESIVLYSKEWTRLVESEQIRHTDDNLIPESFRQALLAGRDPVASKVHFHENGGIGFHIGIPVADNASDASRYIVAVLDLSAAVYPILQTDIDRQSTIYSYIVSADGHYLSAPSDLVEPMEDRIDLPPVLKQGRGERPAVYKNAHGDQVVGVTARLDVLDWILVSEARTADSFAWLGHLRLRALVTGLITLILVFVLAGKFSNRISLPLRRMAEVAHTVSSGQYDTRMEHFQGLEHQEVAEAFNGMLDEIARAHKKLIHTAALSAIGELSASIVHEIRNPLSAIKMNLAALKRQVAEDPVHQELAEIADTQIRRLEAMLRDLLQYGKRMDIEKKDVAVEPFMHDVEACIRAEKGKSVSFQFKNKCGAACLPVDREQMLRAVSNLVDNAVQASPNGGSVTLTLNETPGDPALLRLEVADSGPGISEHNAKRLFEPFFTTRTNGTGLGLANVKKIIELHGGRISFRNGNSGAVFTIELPKNGSPA